MQYTEEHYAQMYNGLPEGLKDLVLSGRLAILVSAIGSRHGLNADQIADLEPAIEDVCLGLITKEELVENIRKSTDVDQRVANRIAAEAELEILRPFEAELVVARKQKEELDEKIGKVPAYKPTNAQGAPAGTKVLDPQNVSEHAVTKKVSDWYTKDDNNFGEEKKDTTPKVTNFDWDKDFAKREELKKETEATLEPKEGNSPESTNIQTANVTSGSMESKLNELTESINKLVNTRFGGEVKKDDSLSVQMLELTKRLERAEKENEENKKIIKNLQSVKPIESIFGTQIVIDKERKVDIARTEPSKKEEEKDKQTNGNIQITSVSKSIPIEKKEVKETIAPQEIITSTVSKDTLDSIVATRNKVTPLSVDTGAPAKKTLTLQELINDSDSKIKVGHPTTPQKSATLVFPGLNDEKKIDIKNMSDKASLKNTLLEDLEFLKTAVTENESTGGTAAVEETTPTIAPAQTPISQYNSSATYASNPFKEELLPKTKEERMKVLQDKIKALNKGVSVGGKNNFSAGGLDPYRL